MTDYASLDYPNNKLIKDELIKLINLFNSNNIHYWVDFATLAKVVPETNSKYLNYLSGFDISVFQNDYNKIDTLLTENNFYITNKNDIHTYVSYPEFLEKLLNKENYTSPEIEIQNILKRIIIWNYKLLDNDKTNLGINKDFTYNRQLFLETKEIEHCGLILKIPKDLDSINKIRNPYSHSLIWSHSPRKRENCEKEYGFNNIGDYK